MMIEVALNDGGARVLVEGDVPAVLTVDPERAFRDGSLNGR